MTTIGTILKKEREKQKISLNEISQETKIGIKYLKAIEANDYTIFPSETYIIGFIRNYARALKLDPVEIVSMYKAMKIQAPSTISEEIKKEEIVKPKTSIKPQKKETPIKTVKIQEEKLLEITPRRKPKPETQPEKKPLLPLPLSEKKFINPVFIFVSLSVVIFVFLFTILIVNIFTHFKSEKNKAIYTDLSELKYLEFDKDILNYEFPSSEYFKIKLGETFHVIMFEKLQELYDTSKSQTETAPSTTTNLSFHFDDMVLELKINEQKTIDFDLDGVLDLEIRVNSLNKDLINASIKKLHPFIMAQTTNTNLTAISNKSAKKSNLSISTQMALPKEKRKIVFEATFKERTYLKAFVDGVEQEGKIYYPNDKIRIEANDVLQLKVGNAGGLVVKINDQPYKLGKRGEIANKIIKWERDPYDINSYNLTIKDWQ